MIRTLHANVRLNTLSTTGRSALAATARPWLLAAPILIAGCSSLLGCASNPSGPYAPMTERERRPAEADRLNQLAAEAIATDPEKAESLLREALTADLYHGPAHNNLGTIYLRQGKIYEAAGEFEFARKLMPGHPDPRMNLALALETAGRTDEAIATYRTALEVYPEHLPTMQALARIQVRTDCHDDDTLLLLREIALRGETARWREWAHLELVTREP